MRLLVDVVHPAHVHFYRHLLTELEAAGNETFVVARAKDVTTDLLDRYDIPYVTVGRAKRTGLLSLGAELARRDWALARIAREFRPDVILTRNPAGVQAARLSRVVGVFDTDDGRAVGIHFSAAARFAHVITSPDCIRDSFGAKHVKYPSYKPLAFLHPDRYTPDPSVLSELGVTQGERYFVLRFVAFAASHDRGAQGLEAATKREVVDLLQRHGKVFISSEAPLPSDLAHLAVPVAPHRLHEALAFAALCVTDGQSMAGEAAVLGVPSVRLASSSGRLAVLRELQDRYGLVFEFGPGEDRAFMHKVEELAVAADASVWQERRAGLLADKCDLTTWMLDFCSTLRPRARKRAVRRVQPASP